MFLGLFLNLFCPHTKRDVNVSVKCLSIENDMGSVTVIFHLALSSFYLSADDRDEEIRLLSDGIICRSSDDINSFL